MTVEVEQDVFEAAKRLAVERSVPVDAVINDLARRGLASVPRLQEKGGLPVFTVGPGAGTITTERVKEGEDEL